MGSRRFEVRPRCVGQHPATCARGYTRERDQPVPGGRGGCPNDCAGGPRAARVGQIPDGGKQRRQPREIAQWRRKLRERRPGQPDATLTLAARRQVTMVCATLGPTPHQGPGPSASSLTRYATARGNGVTHRYYPRLRGKGNVENCTRGSSPI